MSNQHLSHPSADQLVLSPPPQLALPSAPNPALSSASFPQPHHNTRSQFSKKTLSQVSPIVSTSYSSGRQSIDISSPTTQSFSTPSLLSPTIDRQTAPRTSTSIVSSTTSTSLTQLAFLQRNSLAENPILNSTQLAALRNFSSPNTIPRGDLGAWEALLSKQRFPATLTPQDAYDLEMATVSLAIELAANNVRTENFNNLLLHLLTQLRRFNPENCKGIVPVEVYNAFFLVRTFSKHFVGNLSGEEIYKQFEGTSHIRNNAQEEEGPPPPPPPPPPPRVVDHATLQLNVARLTIDSEVEADARPKAEQLLDALLRIIVQLDPNTSYSAYEFYLEALNTLIVFLSTQIHQPSPNANDNNYFLNILMENFGARADAVIGTLMNHFIAQKPMPPISASVVYNAYSYFFSSKPTAATTPDPYPVADRSILLILLLSTQSRSPKGRPSDGLSKTRAKNWGEAYRRGIAGLRDENTLAASESSLNEKPNEKKIWEISFRSLYQIICQSLALEEVCLLFYQLLVENEAFRVYVLSRTDPDTLFVPILKMVYEALENKANYSHVYILLIILLLFSQDDIFNENIQKIILGYQAWFTERPLLKSISLGGLAVLVLIRAIQLNLSNHRDIYFHTNSLATLVNMSSSILDIHPYVAQRLVSLFDLVAKRYQKLLNKAQTDDGIGENSPDVAVYGDLLSLVLEIINSVLSHHLKNNTQLVYALLHKKDMFALFRLHPRFSELIGNIEEVVNYFNVRVDEANLRAPSTEEVLDLIEQTARTWPPSRLKPLAGLRFQYEEETDSQEFFCPYIWVLMYRKGFIYWDEDKAHILEEYRMNAENDTSTISPVA